MGWFISIMTPLCVTRQFHWPEVFFFLIPSPLGWRLFSKGGSANGTAWDHTGNKGGGFSKHTWAILKFGCVSWRSNNKERGWRRTTEGGVRQRLVFSSSFLFWGEVTVEGWASKHTSFWFPSFPLILSYKSTMWLHILTSEYAHQKSAPALHAIGKASFQFNVKLQACLWPIMWSFKALESMSTVGWNVIAVRLP